jgi:formylglycine-generating enzyme required for sulfatase activity/HEAT repeat protein
MTDFDTLQDKLDGLRRRYRLHHLHDAIKQVQTDFALLARQLRRIQDAGYAQAQTLIDTLQTLRTQWHTREDAITQSLTTHMRMLRMEFNEAEEQLQIAKRQPDSDDLRQDAQAEIDDLEAKILDAERDIEAQLTPYKQLLQIRRRADLIDWSLPHWEATSATKHPGESLIIAADAEWVIYHDPSADPDGVLFLTNQRLIFEKKEKQARLFGLMDDAVEQEVQWAVDLKQITVIQTEDTPKEMLYLTLTEDASHQKITLEMKGQSDNDEWRDYILTAQAGGTVQDATPPPPVQEPPTAPIDQPPIEADEDEPDNVVIIPVINLDDEKSAPAPQPEKAQASIDYDTLIEWVHIPGVDKKVSVTIPGDMRERVPPRTVQKHIKAPSFSIAKTPITNAQWETFVDDPDGYKNPRWWFFAPQAMSTRRRHSYLPPLEGDDAPRTGISYYDALAFCRWLSEKTSQPITLPSAEERDHAFDTNSNLVEDPRAKEWTVSGMYNPHADPLFSHTSRVVKVKKQRTSKAMSARVKDVGFRPVILASRIIADYVPNQPVDYYLNKLEARKNNGISIPPEAFSIALLRDPNSIPRLIALLKSDLEHQRLAAIKALGYLADMDIPTQKIIDYIDREDNVHGRSVAYWLLIDSGAKIIPILKENLKHDDPIVREKVFAVLTRFHFQQNIVVDGIYEIMRTALKDPDETVVATALDWARLADKDALLATVQTLNGDKRVKVRAALQALYDEWGIEHPQTPAPVAQTLDATVTSTPQKDDVPIQTQAQAQALADVIGSEIYWLSSPAGSTTIERQVMTGYDQYKMKKETLYANAAIIAQFPVKVEQFQHFVDDPNGYTNKRWWEYSYTAMQDRSPRYIPPSGSALDPVDNLNFWDVLAFIRWLNTKTGHGYRLPFEAEWLQAVEHLDLAFPHTEWLVSTDRGYNLQDYGGVISAVRRGNKYGTTDNPLAMRQDLIPLGRHEGLSFRLVDTGQTYTPSQSKHSNIKTLLEQIRGKGVLDARNAAHKLAIAADPASVPALIDLLDDKKLIRHAAFILSWIADRVPVPIAPIIQHLNNRPPVLTYLNKTLVQIGEPAFAPLQQTLEGDDALLRERALSVMASINPEATAPLLIDHLQHDASDDVRAAAAITLGRVGNADAIPYLEKAIRSNHPRLIQNAKRAIEKIKER